MVATKMNLVLSERNRVKEFWLRHSQLGKLHTVNHFKKEGFKRRCIYKVIQMVEAGEPMEPKKVTGRPIIKLTPSQVKSLKRVCLGKVCPSFRSLASKFGVAPATMRRICRQNGLHRVKRKIRPKVSPLPKVSSEATGSSAQELAQRQGLDHG